MDAELNKVREFHCQIGAAVAESPTLLACQAGSASEIATAIRGLLARCQGMAGDDTNLLSRLCLALEELAEWVEAHAAGDLVAAVDAWGDRLYVLLGDAAAAGLPADAIFDEVHRSNMSKAVSRPGSLGKGTKGSEFRKPRLEQILCSPQAHDANRS